MRLEKYIHTVGFFYRSLEDSNNCYGKFKVYFPTHQAENIFIDSAQWELGLVLRQMGRYIS